MTSPLGPEETAAHLVEVGETAAATLMRAMVRELSAVRRERDALAQHARHIAGLPGDGMSHNCQLTGPAREALDVLRVTRRCPSTEDGQHWPLRRPGGDIRCAWCHACLPDNRPGLRADSKPHP